MNFALRFFLSLFTIWCCPTIVNASVETVRKGVVYERTCVLVDKTIFFDEFVAAKTGGSSIGGELTGSIRDSFRGGRYQRFVLDEDVITYRASDYVPNSSRVGDFFGDTKPFSALDAEELYNIKLWGNNAHNLGGYRIKAGTEVYFGPVQGGAGQQFYVPNAQSLLGDQIEFVGAESLYRTLPSFR